jgi:hypothetical protein
LIASLAVALVLAAHDPAQGRTTGVRADSVKTFKYVRSAQASFELFRRARLPRGESHGGGDCDVRIGRFCYWRGEDDDQEPPPEAPAIVDRRNSLIHLLDSAASLLPGDEWIAGQRVRYLVEAGRTDDALSAAGQCRADAWWCAALGGYAAHVGGRFAIADSLYEIALDAMPADQRCRWMDIRDVVEHDLDGAVKHGDCAAREATARRIFWLGAPLWSVSETDLLTEHLARLTQTRIAERAMSPDGVGWADDVRALVIRYGWSRWFTRNDPSYGSMLEPQIIGHDKGMPYYFLPSREILAEPTPEPEWNLDDDRAASGYAPSFARSLHQIDSQIATFRRGDSTLVVAAWDVRADSTLVGRELDAAVVVATPTEVRTVARGATRAVGHLQAVARVDSGWVSIELLSREDRRAGRSRVGLAPKPPAGRVALSDLLLYVPTDAPISDLGAASDSALGTSVVPFSRALGVFWETYGLAPLGEHARFSLIVEQIEIGWMQRAAERLGFSDPTTATRVQWEEFARPTEGIAGRGVRVDLSRLRSGTYRMALTVTTDDGATATATRDVQVRDR